MTAQFHDDGTLPGAHAIWVFGSNLAGRHGAGAALVAKAQFGARNGVGMGRTGQAYAIPTKDGRSGGSLMNPAEILELDEVATHVAAFCEYARSHPELQFFVTRVGCGLAGSAFNDQRIAPLFIGAPLNCSFPRQWQVHLREVGRSAPARRFSV